MSDYGTTVGVSLYDDFSKITSELPRLIEQLRKVQQEIVNVQIASSKAYSHFKALSRMNFNTKSMDKMKQSLEANMKIIKEMVEKSKQVKFKNVTGDVKNKANTSENVSPTDSFGVNNQNIKRYINNLNKAKDSVNAIGRTSVNTNKKLTDMFSVGKIYFFINYTKQMFRGLGNIIANAMDFTETENYFSRAMGNMYDKAMSFQNKLTDMYGMSMNTMMNAQATYKNMIGSLGGLSDEMAYKLSETVTKMTLDFSSLYNVDFDKTVQKMQSALSKQVRPIRSVSGYDITQNVLGATAQSLGIERSISEMNELEKRMLIILTLANQMRNSGAMNDFARTIEQPSNQLRILQEQIIEVGRWLGSVFYGVIGSILPYINGFVMAIKELIKTFALFVGYTIPDSSGETQTILDSLSDGTDNINTGLGNAGKKTDKNIKKAKEWKNVLMSFDVADVLPDQSSSDTSGTGGSGSGGGAGGMSVDPRILDALNNYKYIFDDVHMKAKDIRDRLLEWYDIAKKSFNERIFQPIKKSWDKYGPIITNNSKDTFENIKYLALEVADVINKKWDNFFGSATDGFFSMHATASTVVNGISKFFVTVWKSGGRYFLEGIFDLITAFIKLGVSINDNFVRPTIEGFNNTFGVAFGKIMGTALGLLGRMMTLLSKLVTVVSKNKTAVKILGSTIAGAFTIAQIGRITTLWNTLGSGMSITQKLITLFAEHTKVGNKLWQMYVNSDSKFKLLKNSWNAGKTVVSNLMSKMAETVAKTNLYKLGTESATTATQGMTLAQTLASKATVALQSALTFLSNHPLVAVAIAIGTAVVALGAFASSQSKAKMSIEDCSEEIQQEYEEIKNLSSAIDSAKQSANDQIATTEAQIKLAEGYISKLKEMEDKDGYVKNIESAKNMVAKINEILPNTVSITDDGRVAWKKNTSEISKNIEEMRKRAKQQAYEQIYIESIKSEIQIQQKLNEQEAKREELVQKQRKAYEDYKKTVSGTAITFEEFKNINSDLNTEIKEQETLIDETNKQLQNAQKNSSQYEKKLGELGDTTDDVNKSTKNLNSETKKAYNNIGTNGQKEINNTIKKLKEYDKKMSATSKNSKNLSSSELKTLRNSQSERIKLLGTWVKKYDWSYDQILDYAEKNGAKLTKEEKGTLKAIVDEYQKNGKTAGDKFVNNLSSNIKSGKGYVTTQAKSIAKSASDSVKNTPINFTSNVESVNSKAKAMVTEATKAIAKNPVNFQSFVGSVTGKANERIKEANKKMNKLKATTTVTTDKNNLATVKKKIQGVFRNKVETKFNKVIPGLGSLISATMKVFGYAKGGFPSVGEMFIARENGIPELVGRMGSKNAVANNAQIEGGIYRAVLQAMRDGGNIRQQGGDLYITIKNEDGTKIEKVIKNYNELMRRTGGKGGFVV